MINAILRLRRDNDYNYAKIKDTFIPADGEICLVDTARHGLRAVCGDGVSTFAQLEYISESFIQAYYDGRTNNFYIDKLLTKEAPKRENVIYLDLDTSNLYYWFDDKFNMVAPLLPAATEETAGVAKLYNTVGKNVDGSMTQKAISDKLDTKVEVSLKEDEELVVFSL